MKKGEAKLSAEELALLELMSVLVERFEEEHYPIRTRSRTEYCST